MSNSFRKGQKGSFWDPPGDHNSRSITTHLPHQKLMCQPHHFQSPSRLACCIWHMSSGSGRNTALSHKYWGSARTTQHRNRAKLINLAYKGWQHIRKSKCNNLAIWVEDKDIHPERQILSNTNEHFTHHRQTTSLILQLIQLSVSTVTKHISIYSFPPFISSHMQKLNQLLHRESSATLITEKKCRGIFLPS